jgi:hypothetical protein
MQTVGQFYAKTHRSAVACAVGFLDVRIHFSLHSAFADDIFFSASLPPAKTD